MAISSGRCLGLVFRRYAPLSFDGSFSVDGAVGFFAEYLGLDLARQIAKMAFNLKWKGMDCVPK
jgi:hypothetical protein